MYITFDEYADLGGKVSNELVFDRIEYKVSKYIDAMTMNRLKSMEKIPEAVKRCAFDLIEAASVQDQATSVGVGVASMSNDGVSVTYTGEHEIEYKRQCAAIIAEYLGEETDADGNYLLYRGVI